MRLGELRSWRAVFTVVCAIATACSTTTGGSPTKEPPPVASARAPQAVRPAATTASRPPATAPEATVPALVREPFVPTGSAPSAIFAIEGGLMVVDGQRVGRIVGDGVEWVGKIPKVTPGFGENSIVSVNGR